MKKVIYILITIAIFSGLGFFYAYKKTPPTIEYKSENKIVVYKNEKKLVLYHHGQEYHYAIATGKNPGNKQKKGDRRTPLGRFKVVSIEKSDTWTYDFEDDDQGPIIGAYGPWFIRLKGLEPGNQRWQGIGIHGTHDPSTIGKNDTHGCVRLENNDLEKIKEKITKNYSVLILE